MNDDYPQTKLFRWKLVLGAGVGVILFIVMIVWIIRVIQDKPIDSQADARESCELLESVAERDNCFWNIARTNGDPEYCTQIEDESESIQCADGIYQIQAEGMNDENLCSLIIDSGKQSECYNAFKEPITVGNCLEDSVYCNDLKFLDLAQDEQDMSYCEQIQDSDIRTDCVIVLGEQMDLNEVEDHDDDGLTDGKEGFYGTDPNDSDTDNDGYLDGAEVAAGYDPNGSGKL